MKSPAKYDKAIQTVPFKKKLTPADNQILYNVSAYRWEKVVTVNVQLYFYAQQYIPTLPSDILEGLPNPPQEIGISLPNARVFLEPDGTIRLTAATAKGYIFFEIVYLTNN